MMDWLRKMLGRTKPQKKEPAVVREEPQIRMLESREFGLLFLLYENGPQMFVEIAERTYFQASQKLLDDLWEEGLIEMQDGPKPDMEYSITAYGIAILAHYDLRRWTEERKEGEFEQPYEEIPDEEEPEEEE